MASFREPTTFILDEWQLELMGKLLPTWTAAGSASKPQSSRQSWLRLMGIGKTSREKSNSLSATNAFLSKHSCTPTTHPSGIRYIENFGSEYVRRVMIFCSKHLPPGDVADVPQQFQILNPWGEPEHTNFGHLPAHVRLVTAAYLDRALARHIEAAAKARTDTVCGTKTAEQRSSGESFDFDF